MKCRYCSKEARGMKATRRSGHMSGTVTQWSFQCEDHLEKENK